MRTAHNIWHLGIKELRVLLRDRMLLVFIILAFTIMVYVAATARPEIQHKTPIAVVDEDQSQLSQVIVSAFYPPVFLPPAMITSAEADNGLDAGRYTFVLDIPHGFQRDALAGHSPAIKLSVDATRVSQAFMGSGQIQAIVKGEVNEFAQVATLPVDLALRARFNPELNDSWFTAMTQMIDQITMLSIVLAGAALIREREHGTVEHLLVVPVTPFEIMAAKVWSMELAVLVVAAFSLVFIVQEVLSVPIEGSVLLFLAGATLHVFATSSMGLFMATVVRSMPQFGLLLFLIIIPLQFLSGGMVPRESMPDVVQTLMLGAPTTHFVTLGQAILYRGAGFSVVWPQFAALAVIGTVLFSVSLVRFRKTLGKIA